MEFTLENILSIISILLGLLLTISEILGWSKCDANSISQILFTRCSPRIETSLPV